MPYNCNLKCQSCSLWKENYRKNRREDKGYLTKEEIFKLQKDLSDYQIKRITYIGGEPFLNENILDLAENAIANKLMPNVVTNGNSLNDEKLNEICLKQLFRTMIFSIDGPEKIHDFIRGKAGAFKISYANIKSLQKIKNKNKLKYPKIYIYATISKLNYRYIEEIYKIAIKLNVNKIRFQLSSSLKEEMISKTNKILDLPLINTHSYINEIEISKGELSEAIKSIKKIKSKGNCLKIEAESILEKRENKICDFIGKDFIITPSGNVLICPMLTNFIIGNIKEREISSILNDNIKKIEKIFNLANSGEIPICGQCCVEKIH
jgi:MoaA/NifB/PqqE/SkfB family radical SAM enzyme